mmetsp:Transcript_281/g.448  ORF Transcript_281/g.448 Transcript_281/m.448 type:complete len:706 (+) Transcript_281:236-2353(+)
MGQYFIFVFLACFLRSVASSAVPYCQGICELGSSMQTIEERAEFESETIIDDETLYTRDVIESEEGSTFVIKPVPKIRHNRSLGIIGDTSDWNKIQERSYPLTAVGQVYFIEDNKAYVCTGSLIETNVVLTSAHCALNGENGNLLEDIRFFPNKVEGTSYHPTSVVGGFAFFGSDAYRYGSFYRGERDWILLFLERNIGQIYGWLEISDSILPSTSNTISKFGGKSLNMSVHGYALHDFCDQTENLCGGSGTGSLYGSGTNSEYRYEIDTSSGTSGGPIAGPDFGYDGTDFKVYGVHKGQASAFFNVGVPSTIFATYSHEFLLKQNYSLTAQSVAGVICHSHSHCSEFGKLFCSVDGTCSSCEYCVQESTLFGQRLPIDTKCPEYCQLDDVDTDCAAQNFIPDLNGEQEILDIYCLEDFPCLCFNLECNALHLVTEDSDCDLTVNSFKLSSEVDNNSEISALCISSSAFDTFQISEAYFTSFGGNANALVQQLGYEAGVSVGFSDNRFNLLGFMFAGNNSSCLDLDGRESAGMLRQVTGSPLSLNPTMNPTMNPTASPVGSPIQAVPPEPETIPNKEETIIDSRSEQLQKKLAIAGVVCGSLGMVILSYYQFSSLQKPTTKMLDSEVHEPNVNNPDVDVENNKESTPNPAESVLEEDFEEAIYGRIRTKLVLDQHLGQSSHGMKREQVATNIRVVDPREYYEPYL